jgi:PHD/YefM family antitoxin component YafN of YafNO toxin-antitoxin module
MRPVFANRTFERTIQVVPIRVVPKSELRERIREELSDLGDDTLLVTDRGRPLAVAVSVDRWNRLQERLEYLEDAVAVLEHRSSPRRGRRAGSVFARIEAEAAGVRGPARSAG